MYGLRALRPASVSPNVIGETDDEQNSAVRACLQDAPSAMDHCEADGHHGRRVSQNADTDANIEPDTPKRLRRHGPM